VAQGIREPGAAPAARITTNPAECEAALLLRKEELIVGLEVSEGQAAIYAEYDDEPALLRGGAVLVTHGSYSSQDLHRILRQKDEELTRCYKQLRDYRSSIGDIEGLVSELIRRAEIKRTLTSRGTSHLDREMEALKRVLHRIREP
jgi:hypothetical protein